MHNDISGIGQIFTSIDQICNFSDCIRSYQTLSDLIWSYRIWPYRTFSILAGILAVLILCGLLFDLSNMYFNINFTVHWRSESSRYETTNIVQSTGFIFGRLLLIWYSKNRPDIKLFTIISEISQICNFTIVSDLTCSYVIVFVLIWSYVILILSDFI